VRREKREEKREKRKERRDVSSARPDTADGASDTEGVDQARSKDCLTRQGAKTADPCQIHAHGCSRGPAYRIAKSIASSRPGIECRDINPTVSFPTERSKSTIGSSVAMSANEVTAGTPLCTRNCRPFTCDSQCTGQALHLPSWRLTDEESSDLRQ